MSWESIFLIGFLKRLILESNFLSCKLSAFYPRLARFTLKILLIADRSISWHTSQQHCSKQHFTSKNQAKNNLVLPKLFLLSQARNISFNENKSWFEKANSPKHFKTFLLVCARKQNSWTRTGETTQHDTRDNSKVLF